MDGSAFDARRDLRDFPQTPARGPVNTSRLRPRRFSGASQLVGPSLATCHRMIVVFSPVLDRGDNGRLIEHRVVGTNLFTQPLERVCFPLDLVANHPAVHDSDVCATSAMLQSQLVNDSGVRRGMAGYQYLVMKSLPNQIIVHFESSFAVGLVLLRVGSTPDSLVTFTASTSAAHCHPVSKAGSHCPGT